MVFCFGRIGSLKKYLWILEVMWYWLRYKKHLTVPSPPLPPINQELFEARGIYTIGAGKVLFLHTTDPGSFLASIPHRPWVQRQKYLLIIVRDAPKTIQKTHMICLACRNESKSNLGSEGYCVLQGHDHLTVRLIKYMFRNKTRIAF